MDEFKNTCDCRFVGAGVGCTPFQRAVACGQCGFNPAVSAERLERIKEKLNKSEKHSK